MERSRTEYSAMNTSVAVFARISAILMGFLTRVVFTKSLNESYVGVNGLFTDILNILSLTELGAGTAITYALYQPIAKNDIVKQQQLMQLFRFFYRGTACCVAVIGLLLLPFLDILMKNCPNVEHLTWIYLMYLANSVLSYLFVYKRTLIEAHQKNYIVLLYQTGFLLLQDVMQIVVLIFTQNFMLFLFLGMLCTVLTNIFLSRKADKLYPFLREKPKQALPVEERNDILKNIRAMMMHKLGFVAINNTDNLIISAFAGVVSVGIYSNYYLLIGSVRQVLDQIFQGITASIGNLGVTNRQEKMKDVYQTTFFIAQWLYGFSAICLYELLNPFVKLSFGDNYLFSSEIVWILCLNFWVAGIRKATLTFRDSLGLFWYDRYKSLLEAVGNLFFSILLVKYWGVFGVFFGTFLSALLTSVWVEPFVLLRKGLQTKVSPFFMRFGIYTIGFAFSWIVTDAICNLVEGNIWVQIIGKLWICFLVPNVLWIFFYHRTREWQMVLQRLKNILALKRHRSKNGESS